jgi:hypothetical protein
MDAEDIERVIIAEGWLKEGASDVRNYNPPDPDID